jgi:hypothetical protein
VESAFFEPAGPDSYIATAATVGPWSPDAQHGGPPSALAARAIEAHEPDERQRLARVSIDILRPIPIGKLTLSTRMVRAGRRIALVEAVMEADGQEVLTARGWRIERPSGEVPEVPDVPEPPGAIPEPDASRGIPNDIFQREHGGYLASIEWRFWPRSPEVGRGRAAWTRPLLPLLPGEDPSPMSRVLLVADSGSGVSAVLPASDFLFLNVDLTVVLSRDPVGEWLLLDAATTIGKDGTGLAVTRLSDQLGACGQGLQTLLVAPRSRSPRR